MDINADVLMYDMPKQHDHGYRNTARLLKLPREVRDIIIGEVFFPGEKQPKDFDQDELGLSTTAVRQIFPYNKLRKPSFDVSVLRTCRQFQEEGEAILYGSSSWNLMYADWHDRIKLSYEFLEKFPKRLRRLIRRVERKCYSEPYSMTISLFDWKVFMTFLARECPNLKSLKLWGPGDVNEIPAWLQTCRRDKEWVQSILQIGSLVEFDIPAIPRYSTGAHYDFHFVTDFLPWLKSSLMQPRHVDNPGILSYPRACCRFRHLSFLNLDRHTRNMVYRYVILPANRRIHPYIKSWYDQDTRNVIPLFLTCKLIHRESEIVLYTQGIFTAPLLKYEVGLLKMIRPDLDPGRSSWRRQLSKYNGPRIEQRLVNIIRHISINAIDHDENNHQHSKSNPLLSFAARFLHLDTFEIIFVDSAVRNMNNQWTEYAPNAISSWRGGLSEVSLRDLARLSCVLVRTSGNVTLSPGCLEWLTEGLRREKLFRLDESAEIDWLYEKDTRKEDAYDWHEL
ncbi:hypothetical protein MMC19_001751 [Ptychographa xylographoides]|nr:hypothetical protein [Ptychographa xylographoides]